MNDNPNINVRLPVYALEGAGVVPVGFEGREYWVSCIRSDEKADMRVVLRGLNGHLVERRKVVGLMDNLFEHLHKLAPKKRKAITP